jgi:hypothetical protein
MSYVQTPPTAAVPHKQLARSYLAQGRTHTTTTGSNQNQTSLSNVPSCSERITAPTSQGQPSFTAINPKRQSEVSNSTPSAGTPTAVVDAPGVKHDKASRPALVHSSNAESRRLNTSKSPRSQARTDVMKTSHSWVQTPPKQSDSSSIPVQQQDVEYSQAKGTQTIVASINQAKQRPGVPVIERNQQNSNSARLVGPSSTRLVHEAQKTVTVDLASISDPSEKASDTTCVQTNFEDRRALELGNLVNQAIEKGQQRQKHADEARSFDLKRQEAELVLSQLTEEMNKHMVKLSGLYRNLERLHNQVAELDNKVKAVRQQADRTRDTAKRVTLECRAYTESIRKAEKEFANTNEELKQLIQVLGII